MDELTSVAGRTSSSTFKRAVQNVHGDRYKVLFATRSTSNVPRIRRVFNTADDKYVVLSQRGRSLARPFRKGDEVDADAVNRVYREARALNRRERRAKPTDELTQFQGFNEDYLSDVLNEEWSNYHDRNRIEYTGDIRLAENDEDAIFPIELSTVVFAGDDPGEEFSIQPKNIRFKESGDLVPNQSLRSFLTHLADLGQDDIYLSRPARVAIGRTPTLPQDVNPQAVVAQGGGAGVDVGALI